MNYEDILALVHAGYTKDDIAAMGAAASATPAPEPEPAAEPPEATAVQSPDAVPAAQPAAQSAAQPAAQPVIATEQLLQQLLGGISTLTDAVQAQNRAGITGVTPPKSNADLAREATARMAGIPYEKE